MAGIVALGVNWPSKSLISVGQWPSKGNGPQFINERVIVVYGMVYGMVEHGGEDNPLIYWYQLVNGPQKRKSPKLSGIGGLVARGGMAP